MAKFWKSFHQLLGTTLSYSTVFTHKWTDKLNELTRIWRIWYELVRLLTAQIGRATYHLQSSLTTTAFKQVFGWHPLRPFTGGSAEHC
jgi:hypothetical protein